MFGSSRDYFVAITNQQDAKAFEIQRKVMKMGKSLYEYKVNVSTKTFSDILASRLVSIFHENVRQFRIYIE